MGANLSMLSFYLFCWIVDFFISFFLTGESSRIWEWWTTEGYCCMAGSWKRGDCSHLIPWSAALWVWKQRMDVCCRISCKLLNCKDILNWQLFSVEVFKDILRGHNCSGTGFYHIFRVGKVLPFGVDLLDVLTDSLRSSRCCCDQFDMTDRLNWHCESRSLAHQHSAVYVFAWQLKLNHLLWIIAKGCE